MSASEIVSGLQRHARERGGEVAVREVGPAGPGRSYRWQELASVVAALAHRLEALAPRVSGAAVLVSGGNQFEVLASILAGLHADLAVAPCAGESTASELQKLAREVDARVAIAPPEVLERLAGCVAQTIDLGEVRADDAAPASVAGRGDGSILLRSSGTTGPPKVVRRTARALDAVGAGCRAVVGLDASDEMLVAIPVYHSYGIDMAVLTAVPAGATVELHERFDVGMVRRALKDRALSCLPAVPVMFDALARGAAGTVAPRALRRAISAGSPLPRGVAERFTRVYGVPVCQIYGATEFGSVAFNGPELWDAGVPYRPECVGRGFPGVEIRVVAGDDPQARRPFGSEGQVAVRSPSMLTEYLGDEQPPTRSGFLLTGDLGRIDESGMLELTGRLKLMVDVGGQKVNPLEVEAVLRELPGVRDVVVVPTAYSETASRLKAIVIPEPGAELSREQIRRFAQEHLIAYKVPRSIEITSEVPRSPTGKILRQQLMPADPPESSS